MFNIIQYKKYPLLIFLIIQILGCCLFAIHKVQHILPTGNNDFLDYIYTYSGIIEGLSLTISFFLILSLVFRNKQKRLLTINGTKGILKVDLIKNNLSLLSVNKTRWKNIQFRKNNINSTYADLVSYFFNKIKNKSLIKKTSKVKDGLFILKVIQEIKK